MAALQVIGIVILATIALTAAIAVWYALSIHDQIK